MRLIKYMLFTMALFVFEGAMADSYTYTNATGNGKLDDVNNWNPKKIPQSYEDVVFDADFVGETISLSYNTITVNSSVQLVVNNITTNTDKEQDMFIVNGGVVINGKFNGGRTNIGVAGFVVCNGNYTTPNHMVTVNGSLSVGGDMTCAPLNVSQGASVDLTGTLNTSNNPVNISGSIKVGGDMKCAPLVVASTGSLTADGTIDTSNNKVEISGKAVINDLKASPVDVKSGADVDVKGDISSYTINIDSNGSLYVDGNVQAPYGNKWGNINLSGSLELGPNSSVIAADITIKDKDGAEFVFDLDTNYLLFKDNESETQKIIQQLISQGYGKPIKNITWVGDTDDWYLKTNWDPSEEIPNAYYKVNVPKLSGGKEYPVIKGGNSVARTRSIKIASGASLTIDNGGSLTTNSLYVTSAGDKDAVVINHGYNSMAALRVLDGDVVVNGTNEVYNNVQVNRSFRAKAAYYIGSATLEGGVTGFSRVNAGNGTYDDFYSYDPVSEKYSPVSSFVPQKMTVGYNIYLDGSSSERSIQQKGTIQNSSVSVSIPLSLYHQGQDDEDFGWNLLSNPYQFSFPLNVSGALSHPGIEFVGFRRFNPATNKNEQCYYSFEADVELPYSLITDGKYLAPQQAFFVRANNRGMHFDFNPASVPADYVPAGGSSLKSSKFVDDVLYLSLNSDKNGEDQTALVFRDGGTLNANPVDANKKMESVKNNQIYLMKDDAEYAIGYYPEMKNVFDEVLPLGVIVAQGSSVATIKALNLDEFASDADVYLYDIENNESYNMREQESVDFAVESGKRIEGRFAIGIKSNKSLEAEGETEEGTMTGVKENSIDVAILVAGEANGAKVSLVGAEKATVNVYDLAGRLVVKSEIGQGENHVIFGQAGGFYLVEVVAGNVTKSAKIAIK